MTKEDFLSQLPESILIDGDFESQEVYVGGKRLPLGPSLKIQNHSPTGFNWGYGGSGPAQLALAILMRFVDSETAQQYYHQFKFGWVASLPRTDFEGIYNLRQIMSEIIEKHETKTH